MEGWHHVVFSVVHYSMDSSLCNCYDNMVKQPGEL